MAAVKVTTLWTAFISLLVTLLASLGFATSAKAAQQPASRQPEGPAEQEPTVPGARNAGAQEHLRRTDTAHTAAAELHGFWQQVVRARTPRERSLPPTIKQRIGAEAHGSSPAVRHLPALDAEAQDSSFMSDDAAPVAAAA
ncbi:MULTISPECIES: DUF6344 domain-containing protein [unclassified Streptomyces]|uniref:DUF6344 domain-containing protein n=1 Tax=unclassified Streptomyces TaxID=2593676 RepID=UPI0033FDF624